MRISKTFIGSFILHSIIILIGFVGIFNIFIGHLNLKGSTYESLVTTVVITYMAILLLLERGVVFKKEKQFIENINRYDLLFKNITQAFALHEIITDNNGNPIDYKFIDVNPAFEFITGLKANDIIGKTIKSLLPNTEQYWIDTYGKVALTGEPCEFENFSAEINKYFHTWTFSPQKGQFAVIFSDITDRKELENKLKYSYYHDEFTGLYNRRFIFEELNNIDCMEDFLFSIIVCNINGMKMINEAYGRNLGDEIIKRVSKIIQNECSSSDICGRWGGDEFILLLANKTQKEAEAMAEKIKLGCKNEKDLSVEISISSGVGAKENNEDKVEKILNTAEDIMLKQKIYESASFRGQTINIILNTLHEKNQREEQHSRRVSEICAAIGKAMGFNDADINKLRAIGLVHDIGKIGISEDLLNKEGKLTNEEWIQIKKHPEIGYRILSSTNKTSELAKHVLRHHERLDGKGYPNGITSDDVSVFTRILSIADSYDAMTSKRTYRDSLTKEQAIDELLKNSGTQFDEKIVDIFIKDVLLNNGI